MKVSSPRPGIFPADIACDPEDKEISEDDGDHNHKHRRQESRSESLEGDSSGQVFARKFRKRNKPFENGHPLREGGSHCNDTWKSCNHVSQEKDISGRFDRRRPNVSKFSRVVPDSNQSISVNQSMLAAPRPTKGRCRDSGLWGLHDPSLSQVDIASHLVQQGTIISNAFSGRRLPNVSSLQSACWNPLGFAPAIPSGGFNGFHSIGLQWSHGPSINPSLSSTGIPCQRCMDFEERGFCLRGDMCPMDHGVNRIVVDDVQCLSHFDLPVSLPAAHPQPVGHGPLPASVSSGLFLSKKGLHNKISKPGMTNNGSGLDGAFVGSSVVAKADLYDPDQPLWADNCPETLCAVTALEPPTFSEIDPFLETNSSDHQPVGRLDGPSNAKLVTDSRTAAVTQMSMSGRIGSSKQRLEVRQDADSTFTTSSNLENGTKEDVNSIGVHQAIALQGRKLNANDAGTHVCGLSSNTCRDSGRDVRKLSQKALRTLFVCGIPQKENRREALLSHFQKFGEVIDVYIPSNSDRAFVQFLKGEEAEAALKASDAVMGNRFIKLMWANRDSIPSDGINSASNPQANLRGTTLALLPTFLPAIPKGYGSVQTPGPKSSVYNVSVTSLPAPDSANTTFANSPKAPPSLQKKLKNLELLKEELWKKQEMLDQKRNEFRRQLDKLEKQTMGIKYGGHDPASNKLRSGTVVDGPKAEELRSMTDSGSVLSPQPEAINSSCRSGENTAGQSSRSQFTAVLSESPSLRPSILPLVPLGAAAGFVNRNKLDNRPTVFEILPPLPSGLANVSALKKHFCGYGDLSVLELECSEPQGKNFESEALKMSARITFTNRYSAESAFLNGKCWEGQTLQFVWLRSSNDCKDNAVREDASMCSEQSLGVHVQSAGGAAAPGSQITPTMEVGESEDIRRPDDKSEHVDEDENVLSNSTELSTGEP